MENLNYQKTRPTTKCVELVDKKEFAAAELYPEYKIYVVHVRSVSSIVISRSFPRKEVTTTKLDLGHETYVVYVRPQIDILIAKKAPTKISDKYINFAEVFFPGLVFELPEHTKINNYAIKLVDANGFIRLSKSPHRYRCFRLRCYTPSQSVILNRRRKDRLLHHLPRC